MNYWKRLLITCALLAGFLAACGGNTTSNDQQAEDQVNVPQSGSPTTDVPNNAEPAVATGRAGVATAVSEQEAATAIATAGTQ